MSPIVAISAHTFLSCEPANTFKPSGLTTGDESTSFPVANSQQCDPVFAFTTYTLESCDPTNTFKPSSLTADDDRTTPPVAKAQSCDPVFACNANRALQLGRSQ